MTFPEDSPNFRRGTWASRVESWLAARSPGDREFLNANRDAIRRCVSHKESGLRMVVNIGADGLLGFLRDKGYKNAYERPFVVGAERGPSETRKRVDALVGLEPPQDYYFGAMALGGTGVRFYGEYCLVLQPSAVEDDTRIFDRNSCDLIHPPLAGRSDLGSLADSLKGHWRRDAVDMLTLKVLPELRSATRLLTLGTVSDATLHDEDFMEVHRRRSFGPSEIEEVRQAPEEQAIQSQIVDAWEQGRVPSVPELIWIRRRAKVDTALRRAGVRSRLVASSGRGSRWD